MEFDETVAEKVKGFGEGVFQGGIAPLCAEMFAGVAVVAGLIGQDGLREVGVSCVEAEADGVEVADTGDLRKMGGGSKVVQEIFEEELHTERGGEGLEVFDGREREVERFCGPAVVFETEVEDAGTEGDLLSGFEGAFDFVHGEDAFGFVAGDEIERGLRVPRPVGFLRLGEDGHVHCGSNRVGAEPCGKFANGVAEGVVKVVPGGKDFDGFGAGVVQGIEVAGVEAIEEKDVRGDAKGHGLTVAHPDSVPFRD